MTSVKLVVDSEDALVGTWLGSSGTDLIRANAKYKENFHKPLGAEDPTIVTKPLWDQFEKLSWTPAMIATAFAIVVNTEDCNLFRLSFYCSRCTCVHEFATTAVTTTPLGTVACATTLTHPIVPHMYAFTGMFAPRLAGPKTVAILRTVPTADESLAETTIRCMEFYRILAVRFAEGVLFALPSGAWLWANGEIKEVPRALASGAAACFAAGRRRKQALVPALWAHIMPTFTARSVADTLATARGQIDSIIAVTRLKVKAFRLIDVKHKFSVWTDLFAYNLAAWSEFGEPIRRSSLAKAAAEIDSRPMTMVKSWINPSKEYGRIIDRGFQIYPLPPTFEHAIAAVETNKDWTEHCASVLMARGVPTKTATPSAENPLKAWPKKSADALKTRPPTLATRLGGTIDTAARLAANGILVVPSKFKSIFAFDTVAAANERCPTDSPMIIAHHGVVQTCVGVNYHSTPAQTTVPGTRIDIASVVDSNAYFFNLSQLESVQLGVFRVSPHSAFGLVAQQLASASGPYRVVQMFGMSNRFTTVAAHSVSAVYHGSAAGFYLWHGTRGAEPLQIVAESGGLRWSKLKTSGSLLGRGLYGSPSLRYVLTNGFGHFLGDATYRVFLAFAFGTTVVESTSDKESEGDIRTAAIDGVRIFCVPPTHWVELAIVDIKTCATTETK